uniref:EOG090X0FS7 n=1 Tax=Daphnia longispina TaxID=42846 RepID=A0A4Y7MAG3_9CRUS|nr:EOG090X0FS7 [Daphnia longispina]
MSYSDSESPYRSNVSGITALDDSQDMSVVIRPKTGQQMSRIPLPRTTLDNAHFSTDSEITEEDGSRDGDDMPSVEIDNSEVREHQAPSREDDSIPTDSTSNEDLEQLPGEEVPSDKPEGKLELGMSGSYSEILSPSRFKIEQVPEEEIKPSIQNLAIEGTILKEGDMIHFIAKNLETKIRLSSPDISESSQLLGAQSELSKQGQLFAAPESTFLAQLERDARGIAASVDGLTEHLAVSLHTISAVTAQSLTVYKDSVCKTCDAMDGNIKSMYQLMAKCEELSKAMTPIYKLSDQVKEIKKLLDIMENLS